MKNLQNDENEQDNIRAIMNMFSSCHHKRSLACKTHGLLHYLYAACDIKITEQTFRKYVGIIRNKDLMSPGFILSNVHEGYWFTTDKKELNDFIDQELNRMGNQFANIEKLHQRVRYDKPKPINGQKSFF